MSSPFDPSPRASKRRKTSTYRSSRSVQQETLNDPENNLSHSTFIEAKGTVQDEDHDSAYGSKEDSVIEEEMNQANNNNTEILQPTSSGRQRKRPRRYSDEQLVTVQEKSSNAIRQKKASKPVPNTTPKSILTPSKRSKSGPTKSVAFDQNEKEIEQQFGFKDITSSTKKRKLKLVGGDVQTEKDKIGVDAKIFESIGARKAPAENINVDEILVEGPTEDEEYDDDLVNQQLQSELDMTEAPHEDDPELVAIKSTILSRLISSQKPPLAHLESQYDTVHSLLSTTITAGESNSLLLLGARGVGKTLLLETALTDLRAKHEDDFHIVRLNGVFQTDDRLALREIWRQLGREMQVLEDETGEVSSYADTMASLLSLLSHPEELDPGTNTAEQTQQTSKSVIFILDEFDLFTTHPRQTLLYNLFDIAQSRKAPIAVIGCSTRMDVVECLEKRVKSRYSHRWLHIPSARSLDMFEDTIKTTLLLNEQEPDDQALSEQQREWRMVWNEFVKTELLPSKPVQSILKQTFYSSKSIPDVLIFLYPIVAAVQLKLHSPSQQKSKPYDENENKALGLALRCFNTGTSLLAFLPTLPTLHISLLTAAARLETIHSLQSINFNLVYTHYTELIARSRLQQTASGAVAVGGAGLRQWGREVAGAAWEELARYGVFVPVTGAGKDSELVGGEGQNSRMYRVDVTLEEVEWAVKEKWNKREKDAAGNGAGDVIGKWCREI